MKKLISLLLIFFSVNICFSQDIIFKKNKEFIQAKVIDSNATEIFYKQYFNQNGPTYIIFKSELLKIHYETGKVENYAVLISAPVQKKNTYVDSNNYINESKNDNIPIHAYDERETTRTSAGKKEIDFYDEGYKDAKLFYHDYHTVGTATFLISGIPFYGVIFGLAPAIVFSAIPPPDRNLNYPNKKLMENSDYKFAYKKKAFEIKRDKVKKNYTFGITTGTGGFIAFGLIYLIFFL
jgi:hypothetical protein